MYIYRAHNFWNTRRKYPQIFTAINLVLLVISSLLSSYTVLYFPNSLPWPCILSLYIQIYIHEHITEYTRLLRMMYVCILLCLNAQPLWWTHSRSKNASLKKKRYRQNFLLPQVIYYIAMNKGDCAVDISYKYFY